MQNMVVVYYDRVSCIFLFELFFGVMDNIIDLLLCATKAIILCFGLLCDRLSTRSNVN